jgi:phosphate-selective porin
MRHTDFVTHSAAAIGVIVAFLASAPVPATAQASAAAAQEGRAPLRPDHPTITFGDDSHIDLHARVQHQVTVRDDARGAVTNDATDPTALDTAAFQRGRVGVSGTVASRVEFQVEHGVGREGGVNHWRDVFADVRIAKALRVRAGQFKVPFSHEQLTSMYELDFTHRSAAVDELVPCAGSV